MFLSSLPDPISEPFVKRLVCSLCRTRFDVRYVKDPTKPNIFTVTVPCRSCRHANRVSIDAGAAERGDWTVDWPA